MLTSQLKAGTKQTWKRHVYMKCTRRVDSVQHRITVMNQPLSQPLGTPNDYTSEVK